MKVIKNDENISWLSVEYGDVLKIKQQDTTTAIDVILMNASNSILAMCDNPNYELIYELDNNEVRIIDINHYEILRIYRNAVLKLEGD